MAAAEQGASRGVAQAGAVAPRASSLKTLLRHQAASLLATLVDFSMMVACVELLGAPAALGTAAGASLGAVTNFTVGRLMVFEARDEAVAPQAARYAVVSFASALWNVAGEYVAHDVLGVQYIGARVVVAIAVSLLWNYPMQKSFVFRKSGREVSS